MRVTQPDSRTIRVLTDSGMGFFLPYRFSWNGHEREPASVVLETTGTGARTVSEVKAFFLFGMVRDRITADAVGITISRSWNVMTPGSVRILFDVELEAPADLLCLFPGVHAAAGLPSAPVSFLGERTSYPASIIVSLGDDAVAIFSRSARCDGDPSSIGISRTEREDEPARLRVEVRFPGVEAPRSRSGPKLAHRARAEDDAIQCSGSLQRAHELHLVFSPREEILTAAPAAVLKRLHSPPAPKGRGKVTPRRAELSQAGRKVLATHLVEHGGVTALRETPESQWVSSLAGLGVAVSVRRLFPKDHEVGETALRLADFSLKGQLASGLFYESFHLGTGEWRGVRGQPSRTVFSIPQAARIADLLLLLAEDLEREELPFEKYFLAGQRFVDFFVDDRGRCALSGATYTPGQELLFSESDRRDERARKGSSAESTDIGGWEIYFPLARVLDRLGKDRYKKAMNAIARRFADFPWDIFHPPSSRPGRDSDSSACLLAARMFVDMRRRGYRPLEPAGGPAPAKARAARATRLFASLVLPWIRVHGDATGQPLLDGTLVDSFVRQRILFAGNETANLLRRLAGIAGRPDVKSVLESLSSICLAGSRDVPLGTAWLQHTRWDAEGDVEKGAGRVGPLDSRRVASELLGGLLISST